MVERFIDTVMIGSDRVEERARLITRLSDTLSTVVGPLGPGSDAIVRSCLLTTLHTCHEQPLDVVADVLHRLGERTGATPWQLDGIGPGASLALGLCDGHGLTDFAVGAAIGIDRDEVARARDAARLALDVPPAPAACTRRHQPEEPVGTCASCVLVHADIASARPRIVARQAPPSGHVMDRVVARAREWHAAVMREGLKRVAEGPSPWVAAVRLRA